MRSHDSGGTSTCKQLSNQSLLCTHMSVTKANFSCMHADFSVPYTASSSLTVLEEYNCCSHCFCRSFFLKHKKFNYILWDTAIAVFSKGS